MGLLAWFTRNRADTDEPGDPGLRPVELFLPVPEVLARVEAVIRRLPRWSVVTVDPAAAVVTATRRTRLWRFIDDVTLRLEGFPGGTRIHGRSQSRVGVGDFGQNRRNLIEVLTAIRESASGEGAT